MNIYDFDYTIYDGDCIIDFYLFCVRKQPLLLRYLPYQAGSVLLCKIGFMSRTNCKSRFLIFLKHIRDVPETTNRFWDSHERKIKAWYLFQKRTDDMILSASPEFILRPLLERLGLTNLIATQVDLKTGRLVDANNRGEEKVKRFLEAHKNVRVEEAYSDSMSDLPMLRLARKSYIVKGNRRTKISFD